MATHLTLPPRHFYFGIQIQSSYSFDIIYEKVYEHGAYEQLINIGSQEAQI